MERIKPQEFGKGGSGGTGGRSLEPGAPGLRGESRKLALRQAEWNDSQAARHVPAFR